MSKKVKRLPDGSLQFPDGTIIKSGERLSPEEKVKFEQYMKKDQTPLNHVTEHEKPILSTKPIKIQHAPKVTIDPNEPYKSGDFNKHLVEFKVPGK